MARCLGLSVKRPDRLTMAFTVPKERPAREATSLSECLRRRVITCSRCSLVNLNATPCCGKSVMLIGCSLCIYKKNGGYSGYTGTTPRKPAPSLGFRCTHSGKTWWGQVGTRHLHVWAKHQLYPLYPPCTHLVPTKYLMKWVQLNPLLHTAFRGVLLSCTHCTHHFCFVLPARA